MAPGATSSAGRSPAGKVSSSLPSHYAMSFAAVQKHVAVLERAGLVTKQRVGRRKVVRTRVEGPARRTASSTDTGAVARAHRPHDRAHHRVARSARHDRDRHPQGPRHPDHDPHRRLRRHPGAGVAAVGRSPPAGTMVGPTDLSGHGHGPRPDAPGAESNTT